MFRYRALMGSALPFSLGRASPVRTTVLSPIVASHRGRRKEIEKRKDANSGAGRPDEAVAARVRFIRHAPAYKRMKPESGGSSERAPVEPRRHRVGEVDTPLLDERA